MQSRFTAAGVTSDDKKVFLAYELKEDEFKVDLYIVPQKAVDKNWTDALESEWVSGKSIDFPQEATLINPNLNGESILPDDIRSEETGKIRTKQNEWAYQLLTAKLWETYLIELEGLKQKAEALTQYDRQLFDDAKSFWERVLEHRKERDISQERLEKIKEDVNSIFEKLKTFRKTESAEFEAASGKLRDEIIAKVEQIKGRADDKVNFKELIEELKNVQQESRKNRYTKADDALLRKLFDSAFQYVNEQRHHFFSDKTASRIKGLKEVIQKMEASLNRDKKDLEYYDRKSDSSHIKSLELQLIKVKTNMLQEAIASKQEKLKDIYNTLEKLQKQAARVEPKTEKTASEPSEKPTGTDSETTTPSESNPSPGE